jgi:hypothetical protein
MRRNDFIHQFVLAHVEGRAGEYSAPARSLSSLAAEMADELEKVAPFDPVCPAVFAGPNGR